MRSPAACLLCCGSLGPEEPRWLAFAQARLSAKAEGWSSCRASSDGSDAVAANRSRAAA
jgi:hypothetical protein